MTYVTIHMLVRKDRQTPEILSDLQDLAYDSILRSEPDAFNFTWRCRDHRDPFLDPEGQVFGPGTEYWLHAEVPDAT